AHIVGPLLVSFATIALWECTRNVRFFTLPLALWLLAAPWILRYDNNTALFNDYAVAVLITALLLVRYKRENFFGGGWPAVLKSNTPHSRKAANMHRIRLKDSSGQE